MRIMFTYREQPYMVPGAVMFGLPPLDLELYNSRLMLEGVVRFNLQLTKSEQMGMRMFSILDPDDNIITFFNILPERALSGRHN
jgi:hypothetical protein